MTRILIDGAERRAEPSWAQCAHVIEVIDREAATLGRIVTAVRIDGVDAPAFRDADLAARPLDGVAVVEVLTGTESDLIGGCIREAGAAIESLRAATTTLGGAFRRHDLTAANSGLTDLAGGLATLMSMLQAVALGLRVDLESGRGQPQSPADLVAELSGHVEALIAAQGNQDWLTVADVIEYDIEPSLRRWHALFASFETEAAAA